MRVRSATPPECTSAIQVRSAPMTSWASSGVAVLPVPIAQIGSYAMTTFSTWSALSPSDRKSTRLNSSHTVISYAVFCLIPRPPRPTLFPYTTLFRSRPSVEDARTVGHAARVHLGDPGAQRADDLLGVVRGGRLAGADRPDRLVRDDHLLHLVGLEPVRSEEHTSELQSHSDLVCRLLLDTPPTQTYTLSLHDALPISTLRRGCAYGRPRRPSAPRRSRCAARR